AARPGRADRDRVRLEATAGVARASSPPRGEGSGVRGKGSKGLFATPEEIAKGTRLVARRDPAMAKLIKRAGKMELRDPAPDSFGALVRSIMYQQLAGAAAAAILG